MTLVLLVPSTRGAKSITRAQFVYLSKQKEKLEAFKHSKAPGGLLFYFN